MSTTDALPAGRTRRAAAAWPRRLPVACLLALAACGAAWPQAQTQPPAREQPARSGAKPAGAEEARLLSVLRRLHPGTHFTEVSRTDVADLYEVWMGDTVAYVSSRNPRFFVFGRLYDTQASRDITGPKLTRKASEGEARRTSDSAAAVPAPVAFGSLPFADAIRTVHGNGQRHVAVFSDPNCIFCKQLEAELSSIDDVTIHTFLVPFQGDARPIAIWCAADRAQAWRRWMLQGDASAQQAGTPCEHPVARNLALARRLGVQGTPTLFWPDGTRTEGAVGRAELEARLATSVTTPSTERQP